MVRAVRIDHRTIARRYIPVHPRDSGPMNGTSMIDLHGERVYIAPSRIAKTLLAWQIFANVLV